MKGLRNVSGLAQSVDLIENVTMSGYVYANNLATGFAMGAKRILNCKNYTTIGASVGDGASGFVNSVNHTPPLPS